MLGVAIAAQPGFVPQGQFTGNPGDNFRSSIYLTGRNDDSGTRIMALADSEYGTSTAVSQYSCPNGGVYAYAAFGPGANLDGDGYSSGGSVKTALITARPASYKFDGTHESILVGYIGLLDALNTPALSLGAGSNTLSTVTNAALPTSQWLTYNGVTWSEQAIREGNYTYFCNEHLDVRPDASSDVTTFAGQVAGAQINQARHSPGARHNAAQLDGHRPARRRRDHRAQLIPSHFMGQCGEPALALFLMVR